jgi:hypothetical protein
LHAIVRVLSQLQQSWQALNMAAGCQHMLTVTWWPMKVTLTTSKGSRHDSCGIDLFLPAVCMCWAGACRN